MPDNTQLSVRSGDGDIISTDIVTTLNGGACSTGEKAQRVKMGWGIDATFNDVNASQPLPIGDAGGTLTIDAPVGTPAFVRLSDGSAAIATLPVSMAAVPTGGATSAKQDTGNTSLSSIDGKITAVNTGAVVVSSSALPSGASTAAKQPALGTAGSASTDVITVQGIASGVAQPVSAASLPLPSGASTETTLGTRLSESDFDTKVGALTETAPATDTASSGLNGRLQRIAQRITSLIALLPSSIGQKAKSASLAVAIASDQDALPITDNSGSLTVDNGGTFAVQATVAAGATNIAKAEDVASADGDVGVPAMAIRKATPANTSGTDGDWEALQMSAGRLWTASNNDQIAGTAVSVNTGAVDAGTQRVVQANGAGKTLASAGGSASSSGNNTLVAAGTNKLKVFAFSLSTLSTTAVTCIFQSGAGGTELWRVVLQAPTGPVNVGANLSVALPGWLFATASATLLNLNLSSANAVHWSVAYVDEA